MNEELMIFFILAFSFDSTFKRNNNWLEKKLNLGRWTNMKQLNCIVWSIELETPEKVKYDIFQIKLKSLKHIRIIIIIL